MSLAQCFVYKANVHMKAVLYNMFDDDERQKLSAHIRLFVNILRTGKLVTADIVSFC
jgi:hypothetical protein